MTKPSICLAVQYRSYLLPALQGLVKPRGFDLHFETLPDDWEIVDKPGIDGGEGSFGRYILGLTLGDDRLIGLPAWLMRSFRHRCILVRSGSPHSTAADLGGATIGLTGWPDSGHTWTRAILRAAGLDFSNIEWRIGGLTLDDEGADRLGPGRVPDNVSLLGPTESLVDQLRDGTVDAIFTPYMPAGFHTRNLGLRHLYTDYPAAEAEYFQRTGYVPGVHLVTLKREVANQHPWLPRALVEFLGESRDLWLAQRTLLADTSPWELREIDDEARRLSPNWMPFGLDGEGTVNRKMTADFCTELAAQQVSATALDPREAFREYEELT